MMMIMRTPYFHEIHCESSFLVIVIFIIIKATLWTTDFSSIFVCVCVCVCVCLSVAPIFKYLIWWNVYIMSYYMTCRSIFREKFSIKRLNHQCIFHSNGKCLAKLHHDMSTYYKRMCPRFLGLGCVDNLCYTEIILCSMG